MSQAPEWEPLDTAHLAVWSDRDPAAVLTAVRDRLDARLRGELLSESAA